MNKLVLIIILLLVILWQSLLITQLQEELFNLQVCIEENIPLD